MKNLTTLLLLVLLSVFSHSAYSQTIFRATPIDEEQNTRLDNLEAKFESLNDSIKNLTSAVEKQNKDKIKDDFGLKLTYKETQPEPKPEIKSSCNCSDNCTCGCESGECSCSCSTKVVTQYVQVPVADPIPNLPTYTPTTSYTSTGGSVSYNSSGGYYSEFQSVAPKTYTPNYGSTGGFSTSTSSSGYYSSGSSSSSLRSQIRAKRTGRTYAIVSPSYAKRHLLEHGYSQQELAGLSTSEAVELHNLTHGGLISPSGMSGQSAMRTTTTQVQRPRVTRTRTVTSNSACANGQCSKRRGLFGLRR